MPIKLNGATSGSVELDVPAAVGSDLQLTLPTTAGTLDRLERAGNILQVVYGSSSTYSTTNSTSFTDIVNVNITPTLTNSKLLVWCEGNFAVAQGSSTIDRVALRLQQQHDGSDEVLWGVQEALIAYQSDTNIHVQGVGSNFLTDGLDTWNGQVALKFQYAAANSGHTVSNNNNGRTSVTVFEVAA